MGREAALASTSQINRLVHPLGAILQHGRTWRILNSPVCVLVARRVEEVPACLREAEQATAAGLHAAGFLTYEAAPAFDPAFAVRGPGPLPLAWFGLYERLEVRTSLPPWAVLPQLEWRESVAADRYRQAVRRIREYIAAGDTYQVNYSMRLRAPFAGDPWPLFLALCRAQGGGHAAYLDLGDHVLCSASPELFFSRRRGRVVCQPMKGTRRRGLDWADDERQVAWLAESPKDRAENAMIVDMVRNDLGRVAEPRTVRVGPAFRVMRCHTVLQMISTVAARSRAGLGELMAALFPCASITGAPKVRTMQIIAELEDAPRGIYTGAIGYVGPGGRARFNVAIRTVHVDRTRAQAEYGVGGGVVWDSTDQGEHDEARDKALVLLTPRPCFELLETLLWRPRGGYFLLEGHLQRLAYSAKYFGFPLRDRVIRGRLAERAADLPAASHRVRLLCGEDGQVRVEAVPLPPMRRRWRVALATAPVDACDRFLYHKTTVRGVYEAARRQRPDCDDVLLWNAAGELTESSIANLVVRLDGRLVTPPVACGLLGGVYRRHLLDRGRVVEGVVCRDDLRRAERVYLVNSVRGWTRALVVP